MMKNFKFYFILSILVIFASCEKNDLDSTELETTNAGLERISIPEGFNFETERSVTLSIADENPFVKYDVFAYSSRHGSESENISKALNNLIYSGRPYNGKVSQVFRLSNMYDKVYISRKDGLDYSYEIIDISNNRINYTSPVPTRPATRSTCPNESSVSSCPGCTEYVFENGDFDCGPYPGGSNRVHVSENAVDGWEVTAESYNKMSICNSGYEGVTAQSGEWFNELNSANSNGNGNKIGKDIYQRVCTTPGTDISWSLWHRGRDGVDEAVVKFGSELATMTVVASLRTDNTQWVQYTGTYTVPVGQYDTYFMLEATYTSSNKQGKGNFIDHVVLTETNSGNGSCDPPNPTISYPSGTSNATMAFEDLWPNMGDYDFNDLTISYNIETILNTENKVTQLDINYEVEPFSAQIVSGFAIELEGVLPSAISSVTGSHITQGIINTDANGTEQGQQNAVIVFFDNARPEVGVPNTISILFSNPITTADLGDAPFNPFLIPYANATRRIEIHLPNKPKTSLANVICRGVDPDCDFLDPNGFPWAINTPGEYIRPLPGAKIWDAYTHFTEWANSGGTSYPDWFMDLPGYRNPSFLEPY